MLPLVSRRRPDVPLFPVLHRIDSSLSASYISNTCFPIFHVIMAKTQSSNSELCIALNLQITPKSPPEALIHYSYTELLFLLSTHFLWVAFSSCIHFNSSIILYPCVCSHHVFLICGSAFLLKSKTYGKSTNTW